MSGDFSHAYINQLPGEPYKAAMALLEEKVQHPDPGSEFEATVKELEHLPARERVFKLMSMGFDALITFKDRKIVCFSAIRRDLEHQTTHVIRIYTNEDYRRNGAGLSALTHIVEDAFDETNTLVQAGKGKDDCMTGLLVAFDERYTGVYKDTLTVNISTGEIRRKE